MWYTSNDDISYGAIANITYCRNLTPTPIIRMENSSISYVYLLQSKEDKDFYIGFTSNLEQRVKEHNQGSVPSTKLRRPFELIYFEGYKSQKDARHRENNLKLRSRAFAQLKKRIMNSLSR